MWLIAELWVPVRTLPETWNSSFRQVRLSSAAVRDRAPRLTITQGTWPVGRSLRLVKASKLTTLWARRAIWYLRRQTISLDLWQQRPKIRIIGNLETLSSNSWPDLSHHKEMARLWIRHSNRFNNRLRKLMLATQVQRPFNTCRRKAICTRTVAFRVVTHRAWLTALNWLVTAQAAIIWSRELPVDVNSSSIRSASRRTLKLQQAAGRVEHAEARVTRVRAMRSLHHKLCYKTKFTNSNKSTSIWIVMSNLLRKSRNITAMAACRKMSSFARILQSHSFQQVHKTNSKFIWTRMSLRTCQTSPTWSTNNSKSNNSRTSLDRVRGAGRAMAHLSKARSIPNQIKRLPIHQRSVAKPVHTTNVSPRTRIIMSKYRTVRSLHREILPITCSRAGYPPLITIRRQGRTHEVSSLIQSETLSVETRSNRWTWAIMEATSARSKENQPWTRIIHWRRQASTWTVSLGRTCLRKMEWKICISTSSASNSTKNRFSLTRRSGRRQDRRQSLRAMEAKQPDSLVDRVMCPAW